MTLLLHFVEHRAAALIANNLATLGVDNFTTSHFCMRTTCIYSWVLNKSSYQHDN